MINTTDNLGLQKPKGSDFLDVSVWNENMDKIDAAFSDVEETASTAKNHADSEHAPSDAEKNVISGIQKNGKDLMVDENRKVNIPPSTEHEIEVTPQKVDEEYIFPDGRTWSLKDQLTMMVNKLLKLKNIAIINNLLANIPGSALDAFQGKLLNDKIEEISNSLKWKTVFFGTAENNVEYEAMISFAGYHEIAFILSLGQIRNSSIVYCENPVYVQEVIYVVPVSDGYFKLKVNAGANSFIVTENTSTYKIRQIYAR